MMHMPKRWLTLLLLTLCLASATVAGCGDEEEPSGCGAEGASVDGIKGVVMSPNCSAAVSQAEITARHGSGAVFRTLSAPSGEFSFSNAELAGEGRYQISVKKGPFNGAEVKTVTVSGGKSGYVVMTL